MRVDLSTVNLIFSHYFFSKGVVNISIKTLRRKKGLSQKELAELLGLNQSAVAQWETGKTAPNFRRLKKLTEILECSVDDLLED